MNKNKLSIILLVVSYVNQLVAVILLISSITILVKALPTDPNPTLIKLMSGIGIVSLMITLVLPKTKEQAEKFISTFNIGGQI
jgi:hypothetical protein